MSGQNLNGFFRQDKPNHSQKIPITELYTLHIQGSYFNSGNIP